MSTDWNIRCVPCGETLHFNDANHREDMMLELIAHREELEQVAPLLRAKCFDVRIETSYGDVSAEWFLKHKGHELRPYNEYGAYLNQCEKWVTCDAGEHHKCILDRNHDGSCDARQKPKSEAPTNKRR